MLIAQLRNTDGWSIDEPGFVHFNTAQTSVASCIDDTGSLRPCPSLRGSRCARRVILRSHDIRLAAAAAAAACTSSQAITYGRLLSIAQRQTYFFVSTTQIPGKFGIYLHASCRCKYAVELKGAATCARDDDDFNLKDFLLYRASR